MPQQNISIQIPISRELITYAETVIVRLGYLYPKLQFDITDGGIEAVGDGIVDTETLRRDVQYALYREKIYAETLELRIALVKAVTHQ